MMVIHRYTLNTADRQEIVVPMGARLLSVHLKDGQPSLWALVDPARFPEKRVLRCHHTNHWIDDVDRQQYLGTVVMMQRGGPVFHYFEERETDQ
jgi:hypothetical protein